MVRGQGADKVLDVLCRIESRSIALEDALERITSIIRENLSNWGVVANAQNSWQVAKLISAQIAPNDPLSIHRMKCVNEGTLPEFSDDPPAEFALERAASIIMSNLEESFGPNLPKKGAKLLDQFIEKSGYLPPPNEVWE